MGFMHVRYHLSKRGDIYRSRSIIKRAAPVNEVSIFDGKAIFHSLSRLCLYLQM